MGEGAAFTQTAVAWQFLIVTFQGALVGNVGRPKKIAVIHDWLVTIGGAEKVLREIFRLYPDADLYCVVCHLNEEQLRYIGCKKVHTTFIQKLPFSMRHYRTYLPFMPVAIEQFDLSGYDMVISSSYAVAKGVITGPNQKHIAYVHSPIRYAWDLQHTYMRQARAERGLKSILMRLVLHYIRMWDVRTAFGPDVMIANSAFVARRIRKCYGREATVIYPPVELGDFKLSDSGKRDDFYLTASRMVPYKRIPLVVEAFRAMPSRNLVVIGDGPEMAEVKRLVTENITVLGHQPADVLRDYMQRAKAFVFAAEEDFGIVPVEAQACGTPVIAFGKGGALETVCDLDCDDPTGVFFDTQSISSIIEAVSRFELSSNRIKTNNCRNNALRFSQERFRHEFSDMCKF